MQNHILYGACQGLRFTPEAVMQKAPPEKHFSPAATYLPFDHAIAAAAQHHEILRAFEQSAAEAQPAAVRQPPRLLRGKGLRGFDLLGGRWGDERDSVLQMMQD